MSGSTTEIFYDLSRFQCLIRGNKPRISPGTTASRFLILWSNIRFVLKTKTHNTIFAAYDISYRVYTYKSCTNMLYHCVVYDKINVE